MFPNGLPNMSAQDFHLLGIGAYGKVSALPKPYEKYAIKEHYIGQEDFIPCLSWNHEYRMQKGIYESCNDIFREKQLSVRIVKPHIFSYGTYDGALLRSQNHGRGANLCYFIMDRVYGILYEDREGKKEDRMNSLVLKKLKLLLGDAYTSLHFTTKPFHVFFGTLENSADYISLGLCKGVNIIETLRSEVNYCMVDPSSWVYKLCIHMMDAFFSIIQQGYMPRDIEYGLDGNKDDTLLALFDYNEVQTLEERKGSYGNDYNVYEDIAHVYIDLCGLRKSTVETNPQAPYNQGTPQWKFLPNPLLSMGVFFDGIEHVCKGGFPVEKVLPYIYGYIQKHYFRHAMKKVEDLQWHWKPYTSVFVKNMELYETFDKQFQMYIINKHLESYSMLYGKEYVNQEKEYLETMEYERLLHYLTERCAAKKYNVGVVDDEDPFSIWNWRMGLTFQI